LHVVLCQPEIPPNTGNIARLCAATQVGLHLIEPLGFKLEDRYLKRAGLDYWPLVDFHVWHSMDEYLEKYPNVRLVMTSAKRGSPAQQFAFDRNDSLVFGRETKGLSEAEFSLSPHCIRLPFAPEVQRETHEQCVRSINLSTAAGIIVYMALDRSGVLNEWV